MPLYFYPPELQAQFVNRERELRQLGHYLDQLRSGRPTHVAVFGLRRIGKTLLLKELMARTLQPQTVSSETGEIVPVYMDFSEICANPEQFATAYIGWMAYWTLTRGQTSPWAFFDLSTLQVEALQSQDRVLSEAVQRLAQELQKARPDRHFLIELAFGLPARLAQARGIRFLLILDEFQEIRALENYPDLRNVVGVFRSHLQHQAVVAYFLCGSAITTLSEMVADYRSPLFVQFIQLVIEGFDAEATAALTAQWLPGAPEIPFVQEEIFNLTRGHPFYVTALCQRVRLAQDVTDRPLTAELVREAFVMETLAPHGAIYELCRYVHDVALYRASGYASIKAVLHILAAEEGLTASEVARRLKVTPGTARNYLRWLLEVDLLIEHQKSYYFRDPVLRYWIAMISRGIEVTAAAPPVNLLELIEHLDLLYQRTASELGLAKESQVRELLRAFAGQTVDGTLFGRAGQLTLPSFTRVEPATAADSSWEVDALAEVERDPVERWVVEVKWRNRRADYNDVVGFHAKALDLNARPWLIAKTGLTASAAEYVRDKGLLVSTERELQALAERLGVRFGK
ncbi:MAG: hypothetical protein CVU38_07605 [Chloroflexi bacterium HGW-Chloroflexi-1]|nr:MAG: hypothetical protein CVU38_07605 [Chloroflexi bacterium HGW-Chloroflexi-1]